MGGESLRSVGFWRGKVTPLSLSLSPLLFRCIASPPPSFHTAMHKEEEEKENCKIGGGEGGRNPRIHRH